MNDLYGPQDGSYCILGVVMDLLGESPKVKPLTRRQKIRNQLRIICDNLRTIHLSKDYY